MHLHNKKINTKQQRIKRECVFVCVCVYYVQYYVLQITVLYTTGNTEYILIYIYRERNYSKYPVLSIPLLPGLSI